MLEGTAHWRATGLEILGNGDPVGGSIPLPSSNFTKGMTWFRRGSKNQSAGRGSMKPRKSTCNKIVANDDSFDQAVAA